MVRGEKRVYFGSLSCFLPRRGCSVVASSRGHNYSKVVRGGNWPRLPPELRPLTLPTRKTSQATRALLGCDRPAATCSPSQAPM